MKSEGKPPAQRDAKRRAGKASSTSSAAAGDRGKASRKRGVWSQTAAVTVHADVDRIVRHLCNLVLSLAVLFVCAHYGLLGPALLGRGLASVADMAGGLLGRR